MTDDSFFGKRGLTVKVYNNNVNGAIAQLKRRVNSEGINKELRKRRYFETNTSKRRRRLAEAQIRWKKKRDQFDEIVQPTRSKPSNKKSSSHTPITT